MINQLLIYLTIILIVDLSQLIQLIDSADT